MNCTVGRGYIDRRAVVTPRGENPGISDPSESMYNIGRVAIRDGGIGRQNVVVESIIEIKKVPGASSPGVMGRRHRWGGATDYHCLRRRGAQTAEASEP